MNRSTFAAFLLGETSTLRLFLLVLLFREHPKAQPSRRLFLLFWARDRTCDPWFTRSAPRSLFFLGETSTIGGCFCGFVDPGAPEGSTGRLVLLLFLEKPGIEPLVYKASDLTTTCFLSIL